MRGFNRVVAGVLVAMATVAIVPSALAQEQDSVRASTLRFSETGPAESPRPGADAPPARAAQAPTEQPTVEITDGEFTDDDPEVTFVVSNCASNSVTAESSIFASSAYDPGTRTVTADIVQGTESGSFPATVTCQGQPPLEGELTVNAGSSGDDEEISVAITDGTFTDDDPEIQLEVTGCESDEVAAESPIFADSSFDEESGVITAQIEEGTESGSFELRVTCEGQPTLETEVEINAGDGEGGGGGGGSTPRGGVDAGYGGTAGGSPAGADDGSPSAGWLLVPLLGATGAGVIFMRRRGATDR